MSLVACDANDKADVTSSSPALSTLIDTHLARNWCRCNLRLMGVRGKNIGSQQLMLDVKDDLDDVREKSFESFDG